MILWLIPLTYVVLFAAVWRKHFRSDLLNGLLIAHGAWLLLLSATLYGIWYFTMKDWPMGIGGYPNWNMYHNVPASGIDHLYLWASEHGEQIAIGSLVLVFVSYVFAIYRMMKAKRQGLTRSSARPS
jgi:hypothetical protein